MGQRGRMNLRAFILRLREDRIYCGGGHIIVFGFFDFSKLSFLFKIFWVAILKSERFFSWVNRWSGKCLGSSIDILHEAFKIAHTYTFLTKNFYGFETVLLHYDFVIFSMFYMRIMQSENFATNIHTHYRQSETAPHIRALYARKISPQIYMRNCGAFGIRARLIERWYLGVRLHHVLYMQSSFE